MIGIEYILAGVAALILVSIIANKVSGRLGLPALLIFIFVGMLAGSEGPGGIHFDDPAIAQSIGVVALGLILFSGGLDTRWAEVRPVFTKGLSLSTAGVVFTALIVSMAAIFLLGFSLLEGFLLGAIVSSTDAAAVFSILRSRRASLKGDLRPLLEFESGSNDPMAVFLTIGAITLLMQPGTSFLSLIPLFVQQMAIGGLLGYGMGKGTAWLINIVKLEYEGLYAVLTLASALLIYGLTVMVGGNGFLAAYIAGMVIGNSAIVHKKSLIRFHEGIAWLMQITLFLALGLFVFPSEILPGACPGHHHLVRPDFHSPPGCRVPLAPPVEDEEEREAHDLVGGSPGRCPHRACHVPSPCRCTRGSCVLQPCLLHGDCICSPARDLDPVCSPAP